MNYHYTILLMQLCYFLITFSYLVLYLNLSLFHVFLPTNTVYKLLKLVFS
jgi:hypothetical protein